VKGRIDNADALVDGQALGGASHDNEDDAKVSAADALALFFLRDEWGIEFTELEEP
jgi:hypothetical protein